MTDPLERLRAADPTRTLTDPDPRGPEALALLDRVLDSPAEPAPKRSRRRLVAGLAAAAVAAGTATFFLATPAAAYTVDRRADGSVAVSFRAERLKDTAKLNAELARAGARTVVMRMVSAAKCGEKLDMDPAFPFLTTATPEVLERYPVSFKVADNTVIITIQPEKMPAADTLSFGYAMRKDSDGMTTIVVPAVVRTLPSCMAIPERLPR
ncbi:MAG: hypothetical protein HOU81_05585 [Hamadaea sp.]|uniref:hypothetical protein n=1 Tax=Hamadaea sp. TaxID=2024425 RepID=UPI0017E152DA|nr:hypothetical protein [Hamadaea sp.]NUR70270.1 hypothetical protein [Hamadaea sp.]NUT18356.1 hypothetical protein [Hamadaea sp.]